MANSFKWLRQEHFGGVVMIGGIKDSLTDGFNVLKNRWYIIFIILGFQYVLNYTILNYNTISQIINGIRVNGVQGGMNV